MSVLYCVQVNALPVLPPGWCWQQAFLLGAAHWCWYLLLLALFRLVSEGPIWPHCHHTVPPGGPEQCLGVPGGELECENSCSMYQGVWHSCAGGLRNISVYICTYIQWNLSIEDTIGTQLAVLYRKVFLLQR